MDTSVIRTVVFGFKGVWNGQVSLYYDQRYFKFAHAALLIKKIDTCTCSNFFVSHMQ